MDLSAGEQTDYEEEEYGGSLKVQYQGGGAISALADDDMIGEDDEYDDLYNGVNVGEGFLQLQQSEAPGPSVSIGGGGLQAQKTDVPEQRIGTGVSRRPSTPEVGSVGFADGASVSQKSRALGTNNDVQVQKLSFHGSAPAPQMSGINPIKIPVKNANEPLPLLNDSPVVPKGVPQVPANQQGVNVHVSRPVASENLTHMAVDNGATMLFVGELHWWTTDAELESVLSQYGKVKEIKFFDERASGKSKGYCQAEFYDSAAAAACKEGMNGYVFNGRACVVAFASPQTLKQMGASYSNKTQGQTQSQTQGRRPVNDGVGRGGMNIQGGDFGRNYGRGGWGRGGQGILNRGPGSGGPRGRGAFGGKNMVVSNVAVGSNASGGNYGQSIAGPAFGGPAGGMMHPQGMIGGGFDPSYMGQGGGYGGFPGPAFPGMLPSFPPVNPMGFSGVAPHVNPAFFGRGMAANGVGMMGSAGMDGHQAGMWTEASMGGWGGEEHSRRTRESSYGVDDGASEYGYGEANHEKGVRQNAASRERDRGSERDWSGNSERRHRDDGEQDRDRYDREQSYREERDGYRGHQQREHDLGNENDWDMGHSYSKSQSRSRAVPEEDHRSRSRDVDYGKRRYMLPE